MENNNNDNALNNIESVINKLKNELKFGMTLTVVISNNIDAVENLIVNRSREKGVMTSILLAEKIGVSYSSLRSSLTKARAKKRSANDERHV